MFDIADRLDEAFSFERLQAAGYDGLMEVGFEFDMFSPQAIIARCIDDGVDHAFIVVEGRVSWAGLASTIRGDA
jgi:hypothetical protein